jgi:hypothetical protein
VLLGWSEITYSKQPKVKGEKADMAPCHLEDSLAMKHIITGLPLSLMIAFGWGEDADLTLLFACLQH